VTGCVYLCPPDQYALTSNVLATESAMHYDASVVGVVVPSECVTQAAYAGQLDTPEGSVTVKCCPCQ
jgi:hypothetical protein